MIDKEGGAWSWAAVGVGAAVGALGYSLSCAITGEEFSIQKCIAAASGGAVAGAIAGATTGDISALAIIGIAAGSSAAGKLTENAVNEALNSISSDIEFSVDNLSDGIVEATVFGAAGAIGSCVVHLQLNTSVTPEQFDDIIAGITGFSIGLTNSAYNKFLDACNGFKTWISSLGEKRIDNINKALLNE